MGKPHWVVSKNNWEKEFSDGKWDYLDTTPVERARSAIIGMLCQYHYPKGRILDVGCGLGTVVDFLNITQKKKYLGIDISEEAIKKARKKKVQFQVSDFIDFKSTNKFDVIIFNEVLYHMDEDLAFNRTLDILANNGIVITSLYQMNVESYGQPIKNASRKYFEGVDTIEIRGKVKNQNVTWTVEVLKRKSGKSDIMKTSKKWYELIPKEHKLLILDPDGWDRKNFEYSFNEELITKDEFKKRLINSTIQCNHSFFTAEW